MDLEPRLGSISAALGRGDWREAHSICRSVLADAPDVAAAHHALALTCCAEGQFADAVAPLLDALRCDPDCVRYTRDLGVVYGRLQRWRDAVRILSPVLPAVDPGTQAFYLLGAVNAGEAGPALARFEEVVPAAAITEPDLLCEYGRALHAAGRNEEAETFLRRCADSPSAVDRVHDELASVYQLTGRGDLALEHSLEFVRRRPDSGYAQLRLALTLSVRGRVEESREARLRAEQLGITRAVDWSSMLRLALFDGHENGVSIARTCAKQFAPEMSAAPSAARHRGARRPGRLRVGYVSGEFAAQPASYFLNPFLQSHARSSVEVFLYDTSKQAKAPGTLAGLCEQSRAVGAFSDDELTTLIATDEIDVLVDLGTHFLGNRLHVFNRRAAPVQASLPNCPSTTGCPEVDYMLTDRWTSPPGSEAEYTERLHRLPGGYLRYAPPAYAPVPRSPAVLRNGFVTFGMLQQFSKLGADVWDAIADILRQTPRSRLLLHNHDAELSRPHSATISRLRAQLEQRDVDPSRMTIVGSLSHHAHFELVGDLDVALDTWPFSGTTTTCECLWMSVPVVTRTAGTHASRVSAGLLQRSGVGELVARDSESYVAAATRLASDIDALAHYRATLRDRVIKSGLTDGRSLAREMELAFAEWTASHSRV